MVLSEYNPQWPLQFERIKSILLEKKSGIVFRIEHVGSTSVKNLAAKPTLDIDIVIPKSVSFALIKEKLAELGYTHEGDLDVKGREAFKRNGVKEFYNVTLDSISHHLYACYEDNIELERHLLFRDYISENEDARKAYESLKKDIAEKAGQHRKTYCIIKETEAREFVYSIVEKARQSKFSK